MSSLSGSGVAVKKKAPYASTFELWALYWKYYGGLKGLISSFYFLVAVCFTVLHYFTWSKPQWWDLSIATIPTLLGFTLAGLAVFISMDSGFSKVIAGQRKKSEQTESVSPFLTLVTTFVHFIVVQVFAFLYALTAKSLFVYVPGLPDSYYAALPFINALAGALGYFLFVYSVLLVFAATFAVFRSSGWYDKYINRLKELEEQNR